MKTILSFRNSETDEIIKDIETFDDISFISYLQYKDELYIRNSIVYSADDLGNIEAHNIYTGPIVIPKRKRE